MYTDTDLDGAVAAGVLTPEAALAFRRYLTGTAGDGAADEEQFRLLTGFNDIFVAIATILLLSALAWIGSSIVLATATVGEDTGTYYPLTRTFAPLGGLFVAIAAWGLAEYFTRRRRMALPSILLLLAFVGGVAKTVGDTAAWFLPTSSEQAQGVLIALCGLSAAAAAFAHWRRFHVPITVAAIAAGTVAVAMGVALALVPALESYLAVVALVAGLIVFAFAMRWDMSDTTRSTRRADVAFWLHLLAAPLIVHPIFKLLGLLDGGATAGEAVVVIVLYILLGIVALAVDRRALMVSALFYVLYALATLFREFGAISLNLALTGLVIGSALLLLSAFWHGARAAIVNRLSESLRRRLPAVSGRKPALV
ncbi:hypothetical protein [Sphingomonas prati]|uniref:DUF2157 domain-containing protein n=1 Tax=Sphingomonas prati TaxID=1843237 RepID=A0A7W9F281_9SPHN|nr:hypothetical protein [Sphingomonas prati]MBB5730098.1 hypothetical protein [Sphingomonas prati]GGE91452.1 hypothetical protein GCM10011404_25480 [Sphingomonas prati]